MNVKSHILVYLILPLLLFGIGCATLLEQGNALIERQGFDVGDDKLKRAFVKDTNNIDLALSLVDAYLKNNKFEEAEDLYAQIIENPKAESVQKLHYAEKLMKSGKYEQVKTILDILNAEIPGDPNVYELAQSMNEVETFLNSMVELENYFKNDGAFKVTNLDINSPENDFSPALLNNQLVFASARDKNSYVTYIHAWDNQPFTSIFYSRWDKDHFTEPKLFEEHLQNKFHDGVVTFSKNGQHMYYTQNDFTELRDRKRKGRPLNLKISRSDYVNAQWDEPVDFKYNHPDYNCAHPTLSEDGQKLYFSSDMPANQFGPGNPITFGEMDLYVCEKVGMEWGIPQNLGSEVNTSGVEIFPFVNADGSLFFSSNGHVGFGGLDLFHTTIKNNRGQSRKNLGSPVNSPHDDFGIIVHEDETSGYFCSDRPRGKGHDDIYAFEGYSMPMQLEVLVVDRSSGEPIDNASVQFTQSENTSNPLSTDSLGIVRKTIYRNQNFKILANQDGYNEGAAILTEDAFNEDSIPLIKIPLERILIISEPCEIFMEIDKYLLDTISMNEISPLKIASLFNDCTIGIGEQFYTMKDVRLKEIPPGAVTLSGRITDCDSTITISGAELILHQIERSSDSLKGPKVLKAFTCADGNFSIYLLPNADYILRTKKIGHVTSEDTISTMGMGSSFSRNIYMCGEKEEPNIKDVFTDIDLRDILFDLNEHDIRSDAAIELDKIVEKMNEHPTLEIELGSHTDSRGDDAYNLDLSTRRARSSAAYIVSKGIDPSRITGKGYGETELRNNCSNGINCSEKKHQENRRTEFKITHIDEFHRIN